MAFPTGVNDDHLIVILLNKRFLSRPLSNGDIINIDVSVYQNGFHGDTSITFLVGNVDAEGKKLVDATRRALMGAIDLCRPRVPFSAIGAHIDSLARLEGYTVNREFCGHGIGEQFHALPFILHYSNSEPGEMLPGNKANMYN